MELMKGVIFHIQTGILASSFLAVVITFGCGTWWKNRIDDYELDFSLWKLCSNYKDYNTCLSLNEKDHYLKSVILTTRACMAISVILIFGLAVFFTNWIYNQKKGSLNDQWLRARTVLFSVLVLFMVISIAHAHHCPPCYTLDQDKLVATTSWGWTLTVVAFFSLLVPFLLHLYEDVSIWWSNRSKR